MKFGLEPIANVPVYKRISIGPEEQRQPSVSIGPCLSIAEMIERDRLWKLVVQTATGTNAPIVMLSEYEAPGEDAA